MLPFTYGFYTIPFDGIGFNCTFLILLFFGWDAHILSLSFFHCGSSKVSLEIAAFLSSHLFKSMKQVVIHVIHVVDTLSRAHWLSHAYGVLVCCPFHLKVGALKKRPLLFSSLNHYIVLYMFLAPSGDSDGDSDGDGLGCGVAHAARNSASSRQ